MMTFSVTNIPSRRNGSAVIDARKFPTSNNTNMIPTRLLSRQMPHSHSKRNSFVSLKREDHSAIQS